ncbi:MAG: hypothetical protein IJ043_04975 [Clostridia bacterium]|nr:hypothetical protein [Clostridia bacterium]
MITRKIPYYEFGAMDFFAPQNGDFLKKSFYLALPPVTPEQEQVLCEIPGALTLRIIRRSYTQPGEDHSSLCKEGCFDFSNDEWILEAALRMQTPDTARQETYFLRLPLSAPFAKGKLGLYFDGVRIAFLKEGELLNENYGMDEFCPPEGPLSAAIPVQVASEPPVTLCWREETTEMSAGFYFPHGWNTNVGDVMTFTHNGAYHIAYLLDRRHHGSRGGHGAHAIYHLTSQDLLHWEEQKPIAAVDAPWVTYGTGTMLYHGGRYYMVYGLHTERYGKDLAPALDPETQTYERLSFEKIFTKGSLPAGATYSTSEDGLHFTPSREVFHAARNPSTYTDEKGILLYGGYRGHGVFRAESMHHPFRMIEATPLFAGGSIMKNTTECPAFFEWKGYRYLIVGFTGYFRSRTPGGEFFDAAAEGEQIYDGLSVPMVASFGEDRRLIAGWIQSPFGWGGAMLQRELIQTEGGKLGTKWIPELTPKGVPRPIDLQKEVELRQESYLLKLELQAPGRFALCFSCSTAACNLEIDPIRGRAQIGKAEPGKFGAPIPTPLEERLTGAEKPQYDPRAVKDHALGDLGTLTKPFTLRLMLRLSRRLHGTVLDIELAGRKTMISVRQDFYPTALTLLQEKPVIILNQSLAVIPTVE